MERSATSTSVSSRSAAVSGKLRNLFTPKPKLAVPVARPTISSPSHLPVLRKREFHEANMDENEGNLTGYSRTAHIRQRLASGPRDPVNAVHEPRTRTDSMESVRTIKASSQPQSTAGEPPVSHPISPPGPRGAAERATPARALTRTTSHNRLDDDSCTEDLTNAMPFPSMTDSPILLLSSPMPHERSKKDPEPIRRTRSFKRTKAFRDISCTEEDEDPEFQFPAVSISEVSALEVDDDPFHRWRATRDSQRLEEDRALVCEVAAAISGVTHAIEEDWDEIRTMLCSKPDTGPKGKVPPVTPKFGSLTYRERFDLSIKPRHRHTTMWDTSLNETHIWHGMLFITDEQPQIMLIPRLPVQSIDIEWRSVRPRYSPDDEDDVPEYIAQFEGQTITKAQVSTRINPSKGIHTEPTWSRVLPDLPGTGAGGAWVLRFWVPVPMALFRGRECQKFHLRARVTFGDWETPQFVAHSGTVGVTIEHLFREREMERRLN